MDVVELLFLKSGNGRT